MTNIIEWNQEEGNAYQGDILIMPLPKDFFFSRENEVAMKDNKLILAEGEATGHYHAIWYNPPMFRDDCLAHALETAYVSRSQGQGIAHLYQDKEAMSDLTSDPRLAVGLLVVEDATVVLRHNEHDAIRLQPGLYYVGRQREFTIGEVRQIAD